MKKENSKTRYIALLCSFIIVFSVVLTGCGSVKKITQKKSTGSSDEIQIGENTDVLEGPRRLLSEMTVSPTLLITAVIRSFTIPISPVAHTAQAA